jgi:hypothetical protein
LIAGCGGGQGRLDGGRQHLQHAIEVVGDDPFARVDDGTLSGKLAKDVYAQLAGTRDTADAIIARNGWRVVTDAGAIEAEPVPHHGRDHSVSLTLPPLAAVVLKPRR